MAFGTHEGGVTPDRVTKVIFDDWLPMVIQQAVSYNRTHDDIALQSGEKSNVVHRPHIGWQLKGLEFDPGNVHETSAGQAKIQTVGGGMLAVAPNYEEFDTSRSPGYLGISSGSLVAGSPMVQKRVPAGSSHSTALTADQAAFPSPNTGEDAYVMNRVALTTETHKPTEPIHFRFYVPGSAIASLGAFMTLYFTGPASSFSDLVYGTGQYAMKLYGSGGAAVFELGTANAGSSFQWVFRKAFQFADAKTTTGSLHIISILSDAIANGDGGYSGTKITFISAAMPDRGVPIISALASSAVTALRTQASSYPVLAVEGGERGSVVETPARVDIREDVRALFQVAKTSYEAAGVLDDASFSIQSLPYNSPGNPLYVAWYGDVPADTGLDAKLYRDDTGAEIVGTTIVSDSLGGVKTFDLPNLVDRYHVKFLFSSDGERTPTLRHLHVYRDPLLSTPNPGTKEVIHRTTGAGVRIPVGGIMSVSITDQAADPTSQTARVTLMDMNGQLAFLDSRSQVPIRVVVEEDGSESVLFQGYTQKCERTRFAPEDGSGYGEIFQYDVECAGEWVRPQSMLAPRREELFDQDTKQLRKVTTQIARLLYFAGYGPGYVDVEDLETRVFAGDKETLFVSPGSRLLEAAQNLSKGYFGGYLLWDTSAGTDGMFRFLRPKRPPYAPLVAFQFDPPSGGGLPHLMGSYGTTLVGGVDVPVVPVLSQERFYVEKPGAAMVTVMGGGPSSENPKSESGTYNYVRTLYNFRACNFLNLPDSHANYPDPENPDYLGYAYEARIVDPQFKSQQAVDWMARRMFEVLCTSRKHLHFRAPLIFVTDANDALQARPRPLRFYDIVLVQTDAGFDEYIVASCNPIWTNDEFQYGEYHLVRTNQMDTIAALPSRQRYEDRVHKANSTITGKSMMPEFWPAQVSLISHLTDAVKMPEGFADPIQDLDPSSPGFGDFTFFPDYDPLP